MTGSSNESEVAQVIPKGEKAVYDTHIPFLSLPGLFDIPPAAAGVTET